MNDFRLYFQLGIEHISDLGGYDHILFLVALCAIYSLSDWKKVLILVTAFTIGHSITLALSALHILSIRSDVIEFLIPVTIFLTAIHNIIPDMQFKLSAKRGSNYLLAMFFGLIHGLGFSNYLKMLLGQEANIVKPLFGFNVGLEVGQLIIVAIIFSVAVLFLNVLKVRQREWVLFVSGAAAGISFILMTETAFW